MSSEAITFKEKNSPGHKTQEGVYIYKSEKQIKKKNFLLNKFFLLLDQQILYGEYFKEKKEL